MRAARKTSGLLGAILLSAVLSGAADTVPASSNIITLPPFQVRGLRPWRIFRIPGYEVLSLSGEEKTRAILERIERAARFAPLFLPDDPNIRSSAPVTLLINHFEGDSTIAEFEKELPPDLKIGALHVTTNGALIQLPGSELTEGIRWGQRSPLVLVLNGIANLSHPALPYWYRDGYARLLSDAAIGDTEITIPPDDWRRGDLMPVSELLQVVNEADSLGYTRGSAAAGSLGAQWGLDSARVRQLARTLDDRKESYEQTASLFVHWGLFADDGEKRQAFLNFLRQVGTYGASEALFQQTFGLDYEEAGTALGEYAVRQRYRTVRLELPAGSETGPLPSIQGKEAALDDVARLVGEFYVALGGAGVPIEVRASDEFQLFPSFSTSAVGAVLDDSRQRYHAMAGKLLDEAYDAGSRNPDLIAQMAILAFDTGRNNDALELAEQAIATGTRRPFIFLLDSTLRLHAMGFTLDDDRKLTPEQADAVLEPLRGSWPLRPRLADAYRLLADVRLRSDGPVPEQDLELLADAVDEYPTELSLLSDIARLYAKNNRVEEARGIVDGLLRIPRLRSSEQSSLMELQGTLEDSDSPD